MRARWFFAAGTTLATVALMAWGAFVTSIDAGLAVPDWPTSFNSLDPFNPWPGWWDIIPIRAEHGHRLMGGLVGLLTAGLMVWTLLAEKRRWVRRLSVGAFALVLVQGLLGGLRVVWVSLDLAVVHAFLAQVFFAVVVGLTLFHSASWQRLTIPWPASPSRSRLKGLTAFTVLAVYLQVVFGALLRHPGTGIDFLLASTHIVWAFVVAALVVASATFISLNYRANRLLVRTYRVAIGLLIIQFILGLTAYAVNLDATGFVVASNLQVIVNSTHMVFGALLTATTVVQALVALQGAPESSAGHTRPAGDTADGARDASIDGTIDGPTEESVATHI
jgi:cytochrome c oxidase assembly protein subunit 15